MKIYLAHSTGFDFQNELYKFIHGSVINQKHEIILPHEKSHEQFSSKLRFKTWCDLIIAEVSYPSTGLGIELWRANTYNIPIICIYHKGTKISWGLVSVSKNFIEYEHPSQISDMLLNYLSKNIII